MERVIEQPMTHRESLAERLAPVWRPQDEAAARRTLRGQVAKLERELAALASEARPVDAIDWRLPGAIASPASVGDRGPVEASAASRRRAARASAAGPRLLDLGELEQVRDELAERLHEVRTTLAERHRREALQRDELSRLLRDPAAHRFVRITRADVGEPGCGAWESRPRLGLVGLLADWWHVKISSGCPLPGAA